MFQHGLFLLLVLGESLMVTDALLFRRSSKNRRKAEGKKLSLKEGSPFEDIALLHALIQIIHIVDKMRGKINNYAHTQSIHYC